MIDEHRTAAILIRVRALESGHFRINQRYHAKWFCDPGLVRGQPAAAGELVEMLAARFNWGDGVETIVGLPGESWAELVAHHLARDPRNRFGLNFALLEEKGGQLSLADNFRFVVNERRIALIVGVLTTRRCLLGAWDYLRAVGARSIGSILAICCHLPDWNPLPRPQSYSCLLSLERGEIWPAEQCPLCANGAELGHPQMRNLIATACAGEAR